MNPTVTPEKHEPPALAMETLESLYHQSESSEDFASAKEVKGTCSSSEIPPGLTAETPGSFYHPSLRAPKIPMAEKRQKVVLEKHSMHS